jgi:hypothetical protein
MEFLTEEYADKSRQNDFTKGLMAGLKEEERRLMESTFGTNREMELDEAKIETLVQYGYPRDYVTESLQDNSPNYVTAGYYLLQMDQNYC